MAHLNPQIFRQYDIRGDAQRDLPDEVVALLGRAFGVYVQERQSKEPGGRKGGCGDSSSGTEVIVGRDNRLSSPRLRAAFVAGLTAAGCRVVDIGLVVTPVLYYAEAVRQPGGAAMITASHNPPEDNGFKLVCGGGALYGEEIRRQKALAEKIGLFGGAGSDSLGEAEKSGSKGRGEGGTRQAPAPGLPDAEKASPGKVFEKDLVTPYLETLKEKIQLGPRPLTVAVDCGNGTASLFAERILESWGCRVIPLYCKSDGSFPNHHPDPVKTANLADLKKAVIKRGADLGVAYDGDADRLGVVDERGNVVWGDRLMCLFWREILSRYPGAPAIVEVKCSQALVEEIARLGGQPFFYRTGHSLIKAKMKEVNAPFTGEMSGHLFFADEYYGFDDAFYATGRLFRILSHTEKTLSQLLAGIPKYYSTAETRVPCADGDKFAVVNRLAEKFAREYEVISVDGARVLFNDGWGLARASNTQPVLVARCEAKTPAGLARICEIMKKALRQCPEVGDFEWEY